MKCFICIKSPPKIIGLALISPYILVFLTFKRLKDKVPGRQT